MYPISDDPNSRVRGSKKSRSGSRPQTRSRSNGETGRRKRAGSGNAVVVCVVLIGAALALAAAGGVAYLVYTSARVDGGPPLGGAKTAETRKDEPRAQEPAMPKTAGGPVGDAVILRVQASTVGIWTADRKWIRGAGFFAGSPGLVVTSARVIGHGPGQAAKPTTVEVLVGSEKTQRTLTAKVLATDPDADLALLKVDDRDLPPPLPFGKTADVQPKQMVGAYSIQPAKDERGGSTTLAPVGKVGASGPDGAAVEVSREGEKFWGGPVANAAGEVIGMHPSGHTQGFWVTLVPAERVSRFVNEQVNSGGRIGRPAAARKSTQFRSVSPLPIKPPELSADRTEVKLPSPAAMACAGGGGRFFILHMPASRQLAVFDVNQAKVVKLLPVPADVIHFAAGMTKLLVVSPADGTITRYDLTTFEKEASAPLTFASDVKQVCMGAASAGPLFLHTGRSSGNSPSGFRLVDPATFGDVSFAGPAGITWWSGQEQAHVRASPDGRMYGAWTSRVGPGGLNVLKFRDGEATTANEHTEVGAVVPATDGTLATGAGLFTPALKPIPEGKEGKEFEDKYRLRVPAQTGPFYLTSPGGGEAQVNRGGEAGKPTVVYAIGDVRPIATLPDVELPNTNTHYKEGDFTQDRRVHFVPEARLIAVVPATKDRLVLYRFDLDAHAAKSEVDFLFVTSQPPAAIPGKRFDYPIAVKSRRGGVKYRLTTGPNGMAVSASGRLNWKVPADFGRPASVVVTVSDASGKEAVHAFEIAPPESD